MSIFEYNSNNNRRQAHYTYTINTPSQKKPLCLSLSFHRSLSLTFYDGNERSRYSTTAHRRIINDVPTTAGLYYTVNLSKNCRRDGQICKTGQRVLFRKEGTLLINNTRHAEVPYGRRLHTHTKVVVCVCVLYNIRRVHRSIVFRGFILCI